MEDKRIGKVKLSPFVHKVMGERNGLLVDLLRGRLFTLPPEGDVQTLKKELIEQGLAFETHGVVPFKFELSTHKMEERYILRELQIRLTGTCSQNCSQCGQICACTRGGGDISPTVFAQIIQQFKVIQVSHVLFTGGDARTQWELILRLKKEIKAKSYSLLFLGNLSAEWQERLKQEGISWCSTPGNMTPISPENMSTNPESFFYRQKFNPCWGNKLAVEIDGSIKPCLWWPESLGNICSQNLRTLIATNQIDPYWRLSKDKIETCQNCEYRYNCGDCRAVTIRDHLPLHAKRPECTYDPAKGSWSRGI